VQLDPKYTLNLQEPSAEDKKAAAVAQKKAFEDRFVGTLSIDQYKIHPLTRISWTQRKRGKRPLPVGEDDSKNKKPKTELCTSPLSFGSLHLRFPH
jgi:hypothetical protein